MGMAEAPQDGRNETDLERLDRNLGELLQELRVALPGVQVLFAFLLTVPFQQRFKMATTFQKDVYLVTLLLTALTTALLIAPSAYHRLEFRQGDKKHIVDVANALAIAGFGVLALAMSSAILLVTDFLFGATTATICTIGAVIVLYGLWYVAPFTRRRRRAREA
jgi:Family of unknown function (DUF6328)